MSQRSQAEEQHPFRHLVLVILQFAFAAVLVLTADWFQFGVANYAGVVLAAALLISAVLTMQLSRLSIMPKLRHDAQLVKTGPYRWLRHPMYTATLVLTLSMFTSETKIWQILMGFGLLVVLDRKARLEERLLKNRFPEYEEFCRTRWRLIPLLY